MSEQIQETITVSISSPELLSIDFNELNQLNQQYLSSSANHMIVDNNKSYRPIVILPFPPTIEPKDLIVNKKSPQPNGKQSRAPNAFIIYRKAYVKAAREQGYILPMTAISSMASAAWEQENEMVKEEYKRIAKDAHKLVKEMFPKKANQRKRKEKWNLVSFHNKNINNTNSSNSSENNNNSSEIIPVKESTTTTVATITPIITPIVNSSSSSPILSEPDSNISEKSFELQQQQPQQIFDNNFEEVQASNNYLINSYLPESFQDYLNSNFYLPKDDYQNENDFLTNWLNQPEALETLESTLGLIGDTSSMDHLKNNSQTLNMTFPEAMGIMEGYDLDF